MALAQGKVPRFSDEQAVAIAYNLYEVSTMARGLPSERDQNFLLRDASGGTFILKISNAAELHNTVDAQNQAMEHVTKRDPSLGCPRVVGATSGETINEVEAGPGVSHFVRMLTFEPGVPLATIDSHSPALLRDIGRFFARLDVALSDFAHPATKRDSAWDLENAGETVHSYIDCLIDSRRRALIENFLVQFETETVSRLSDLTRSVIHNDGNDYNVIVGNPKSGSQQVVGIIDFGDLLYTRTVFELCIASAYTLLGKSDPIAAAAQVVSGYNTVSPITDLELELLYNLICMRLCVSVTISAHRADQIADNQYLAISERPAWNALELLAKVSADEAKHTFKQRIDMGQIEGER